MPTIKGRPGKSRALAIVQKFAPKVTHVVDGDRDLLITVTKRDVSVSAKQDHRGCALAVAGTRCTHADGMIVSIATAYIIKGTLATRYMVPESIGREITSFDRGALFEPGEYILKAPQPSMQLGAGKGGGSSEEQTG